MRLLEGFHDTNLSTEEVIQLMVEDGLSFQEIAQYVPWDRKRVGRHAADLKTSTGLPEGIALASENNKVICHVCKRRVLPDNMPSREINGKKLYTLSYCAGCKAVDPNASPLAHGSVSRKLSAREKSCRNAHRATLEQIPYGYFAFLYEKQQRKCFYSGVPLVFNSRNQMKTTLSIDRIIFSGQYEQGNIVFCTNQINNMKSDMTLDEMKIWSPKIYMKATSFIANKEDYLMGKAI